MHKALIPVIAALLAAPFAHAVEPEPHAGHQVQPTSEAQAATRRKEIASALVTVSRFDELLFSACADQAIGVGAGRPGQRDAAAQAAFAQLQPELHQLATEAFAEAFDESTLRAAISFYASEAGQRYAFDWPKLNSTLNLEANKRWLDWTKRIRAAKADAEAAAPAEPAKRDPGF